ncbi:ribose-phosphate diphosphokinase [Roseobacter sp. GAI101]|uniref:ribose-phosphate diphosphokinase n=1 Tax=Roseobacter sp. (strain GAI101) TaxID=391589 RepID=UPI0001871906|nr:ribose-phosphate diphosphokinase [Roseobacter sp. GAI101]EEB82963.1 ribose-phosphate pyrophosphokinase [Roseobacter sp. GAI101]
MLLFALNETRDHGDRIAAAMGQDLSDLEHRDFEDGEFKIRPLCRVQGDHVCIIQSLYDGPDLSVHDKLSRLLFLIATMRDHGAARVTALVPYLCYARKDRRTKAQDPVMTRYVAQLFEAVSCDDLITLETHNLVALQNAFRLRTYHLELGDIFQDVIARRVDDVPLVVMSPDPGGVKRAQLFREALQARLGQPVGFGFMDKRRSSGVMTSGDIVGTFDGASVLIVDDMIASGGTMTAAAMACKANGAVNAFALAAHGLFTPGAKALFTGSSFEKVFVSDSIPPFRLPDGRDTQRLEVVGTADQFADALRALSF